MTYGFGSGTPDPLVLNDGTFTNLTVTGLFTSAGIDDNATGVVLTLSDATTMVSNEANFEYSNATETRIVVNNTNASGDTSVRLRNSGSTKANFGIDGNDSYNVKIAPSAIGTSDFVIFSQSDLSSMFGGNVKTDDQVKPGSYTVATLPSVSDPGAGSIIYVSDETGGAILAFSDGTNFRRVTDRAIVS